ncbi:hypothetical protein BH10PSE12_BH10PSE12_27880 [soil metagenome]
MRLSARQWAAGLLACSLALSACDSTERTALEDTTNGTDEPQLKHIVQAEAQAVLEPLQPPAPGQPGGLPSEPTPAVEGTIDPQSAQGAAQLVQGYYGLLEEKRFADAQKLWGEHSDYGRQDPAGFAARFAAFSEIHANVGSPGDAEGGAGSIYVIVPVQIYARVAATGKPWYALRAVNLRRVNDVDGSTQAQRSWHIAQIGPYTPAAATPVPEAKNSDPR